MSEEREERAFRAAFHEQLAGFETQEPAPVRGPRHRTATIVMVAAAAVLGVVMPVVLIGGDQERSRPVPPRSASDPAEGTRWFGYRGVEVRVPASWPADYGAVRPDCIGPETGGLWGRDVPRSPYVEIEPTSRAVPLIGCSPDRSVRGPEEFGDLPFQLWQPYVQLGDAGARGEPSSDGVWHHRGWTLTRASLDGVRISVLAPPGRETLGAEVVASARRVDVDVNGCQATSPAQAPTFRAGPPIPLPAAEAVRGVALCQYELSNDDRPGLVASRRITGATAADLVRAIRRAPTWSGPANENCPSDLGGSIALRFQDADGGLVGEAYVYYDACFGQGIAETAGFHQLTADSCRPLFTEPPVTVWSAPATVARACGLFGQ